MSLPLHHHHKITKHPGESHTKHLMDKLVFLAAILSPVMTIPQCYKIWFEGETLGVSLISWVGYLGIAMVFIAYGYIHKERPILIMYASLAIIESIIVVGLLIY